MNFLPLRVSGSVWDCPSTTIGIEKQLDQITSETPKNRINKKDVFCYLKINSRQGFNDEMCPPPPHIYV